MSRLYYRFRSACSKVSLFHNFSFKLVADSSSGSALAPEIPAAQTEMLLVQCCLILWNVQVDAKKINGESCLYHNDRLIMFFYVDDLVAICRRENLPKL